MAKGQKAKRTRQTMKTDSDKHDSTATAPFKAPAPPRAALAKSLPTTAAATAKTLLCCRRRRAALGRGQHCQDRRLGAVLRGPPARSRWRRLDAQAGPPRRDQHLFREASGPSSPRACSNAPKQGPQPTQAWQGSLTSWPVDEARPRPWHGQVGLVRRSVHSAPETRQNGRGDGQPGQADLAVVKRTRYGHNRPPPVVWKSPLQCLAVRGDLATTRPARGWARCARETTLAVAHLVTADGQARGLARLNGHERPWRPASSGHIVALFWDFGFRPMGADGQRPDSAAGSRPFGESRRRGLHEELAS